MRIELGKGPLLTRRVINGPTMGSRFVATFFAPLGLDLAAVARDLQAAVDAVDAQMSTWKRDSALMRFNRSPVGEWFALPAEMAQVIGAALQIGRASGGAFDIGVGDLVVDWGFSPCDASGVAERSRPALEALEFDAVGLRLRKCAPITLDLNGIAKGFGVDELARVLSANGLRHYLVAIDGEVRVAGGRPDGTPWQVA
ncbi:MAG: FAD:protein FMN transferase, partial [Devosia sp.]